MPNAPASEGAVHEFLAYIQQRGRTLRPNDSPPKTLDEWNNRRRELRAQLLRSWGGFPQDACPLEPQILGELSRDGYRVEKVVFQTRPGVLMTANAYVPAGEGRRPAVLCVHGHWRGAKQDPTVQARCIGLAKLGFFVLVVDAFGAGERGIGTALGEYHGEMTAATLWPVGLPLSGLQVYENMRAVDYLQSRPEVDPDRIGITGASGGGNQTMYAGAFDDRFRCVVPTCSVGTYQAYLGAACCLCEVVPSAMTYTEEWAVLGLVAPRALMVISATADAFQFSVGEAAKSLAKAQQVFELYGKAGSVRHAVFESKHDYNQPMREAMYGWMTRHLKGEGDGQPIPEPEFETEDPEILRCYPGETRPRSFVTLPQFAAAEAQKLLSRRRPPSHLEQWDSEALSMVQSLTGGLLGKFPERAPMPLKIDFADDGRSRTLHLESEPGVTVTAVHEFGKAPQSGVAVLLDLNGRQAAAESDLANQFRLEGWDLVTVELRATGARAYPRDRVGGAPDHNTAEWSVWTGRPLLGQWVWDVSRLLDALEETTRSPVGPLTVVGQGAAGIVALCTAALDHRIEQVVTVAMPTTYVSDQPYRPPMRLGVIVPGILREVGDVDHLAALLAPRRLLIAGGRDPEPHADDRKGFERQFPYARRVYKLEDAQDNIELFVPETPEQLIAPLRERA